MHFTSLIPLAALASLASAAGSAVVQNHCDSTVYLWSVGGSVGPMQTLNPGASYSEEFYHDPASGGIAIKITDTPNGLYDGSPELIYAYTLDPTNLFYDLSSIFGNAFEGETLAVKSGSPSCPSICWADGISPAGSQVKSCGPDANETLTLCASSC
ncbi:hypothetical protein P175DRAFT_0438300 [Aspergillus ochraceoroseus IBT 24754]|uniref:BYS1 domain protein n=2 Tax=Aspergillus ochraceoroseus TaxID=138278 RepID=A0A2T5LY99_9EURO|nr:uncharacterized protein P175DRAFT_0438300 [Aspergillus ochraceoroseus IBT 24754]KKK15332.1 hypothetical protein AOCH_005721 [Aspergillus ochraceoroseus]PTU21255.1 hypothetical protein P175DRAFT_0438300 [Aspergillus ochraceoroseus IBT 24754]